VQGTFRVKRNTHWECSYLRLLDGVGLADGNTTPKRFLRLGLTFSWQCFACEKNENENLDLLRMAFVKATQLQACYSDSLKMLMEEGEDANASIFNRQT
jgi:hypothetical protein